MEKENKHEGRRRRKRRMKINIRDEGERKQRRLSIRKKRRRKMLRWQKVLSNIRVPIKAESLSPLLASPAEPDAESLKEHPPTFPLPSSHSGTRMA